MSNSYCECPLAGWCHRHQMQKDEGMFLACKGLSKSVDKGWKLWTAWERGLLGATAPENPQENGKRFNQPTLTPRPAITTSLRVKKQILEKKSMRFPPLIGVPIDREKLVAHILYHFMPLDCEGEAIWRRHVRWLRQIRHHFNGRFIVGIVTESGHDRNGHHFMPPECVIESLAGLGAEFVVVKNNPVLGEGVTFPKMLDLIKTDDPNEVFFYGHTKGVTRASQTLDQPPHLWAEAMFDTMFRNQDAVVDQLDEHGICGPFKMPGGFKIGRPGIGPHWFYSGTFFAARSVDVFRRAWRKLTKHYGCVEQWPRLMFDRDYESACIFEDNVHNLYDVAYWQKEITPRYNKWKLSRSSKSTRNIAIHGGDYGDLIYHIPVIKQLNGGNVVLCASEKTRELMTADRACDIVSLLNHCGIDSGWSEQHPQHGLLFDEFRDSLRDDENLTDAAARHFSIQIDSSEPWIHVIPNRLAKFVIARSERYHADAFPWGDIVKKTQHAAVFVGTDGEHEKFQSEFGSVVRCECRDLLEVAKVIAGCNLFIGNQSCPRAIAEGLKVPVIVEEGKPPNTRFVRDDAWYNPSLSEIEAAIERYS